MTITMPEIVVPMVDDQLVADLRFARDLIAVHGLVKEVFVSINGGYCTVGAVNAATAGGATIRSCPRADRAVHELASTLGYIGDVEQLRAALYEYNDSQFSEKADILSLFDTTIARLSA